MCMLGGLQENIQIQKPEYFVENKKEKMIDNAENTKSP